MSAETNTSSEVKKPNYALRRLAALGGAVLTTIALFGGVSAISHTDTVASKQVQIPHRTIGESTFGVAKPVVCAAAESLVATATFPKGITKQDKANIVSTCDEAASDLLETPGDISQKPVVVELDKDFFGDYTIKASTTGKPS